MARATLRSLNSKSVRQPGYLFELYSRWNASSFAMSCRLRNTLGGDSDARYEKYSINWPGQILNLNLVKLRDFLDGEKPRRRCSHEGICLDVVVPSYRCDNTKILKNIVGLRSSIQLNVKFWIVVDNTDAAHLEEVNRLATEMRKESDDGNYFVNVIHYGENRGASYARDMGYNYSTADWYLFLDDDVNPDKHILDAYVGAICRYPDGRVFVGQTALPSPFNLWTDILHCSNVMWFYGVAEHRNFLPWGVTANLLVRGSRHNRTIQFKHLYPKTGGGEDIDFVFQMKQCYEKDGPPTARVVVGVPGAMTLHPWWRQGRTCYNQIRGWAWGDSLCINEWPEKTYMCLPNWIEFVVCILPAIAYSSGSYYGALLSALLIGLIDHCAKALGFFSTALALPRNDGSALRSIFVAFGASSVISSQEITRLGALVWRLSAFSFCRRADWFDGQAKTEVLEIQLRTGLLFFIYVTVSCWLCDLSLDPSALLQCCSCAI
jgi:glycosyltransferase involved in cell wall biosynthesis